jgi:hypothetical protein
MSRRRSGRHHQQWRKCARRDRIACHGRLWHNRRCGHHLRLAAPRADFLSAYRSALLSCNECVPNLPGSSPMLATHSRTSRACCRVVMPREASRRPGNSNSPGFKPVSLKCSSIASRVWSVGSDRTGLPVFLWGPPNPLHEPALACGAMPKRARRCFTSAPTARGSQANRSSGYSSQASVHYHLPPCRTHHTLAGFSCGSRPGPKRQTL